MCYQFLPFWGCLLGEDFDELLVLYGLGLMYFFIFPIPEHCVYRVHSLRVPSSVVFLWMMMQGMKSIGISYPFFTSAESIFFLSYLQLSLHCQSTKDIIYLYLFYYLLEAMLFWGCQFQSCSLSSHFPFGWCCELPCPRPVFSILTLTVALSFSGSDFVCVLSMPSSPNFLFHRFS